MPEVKPTTIPSTNDPAQGPNLVAPPEATPAPPPEPAKPKVVAPPVYPKDLFKNIDGSLCHRVANSKEEEANIRSQGFKTGKELWP